MQINFEGKTKDQVAVERLQTFEPPQGYLLADSYGKDSEAARHLAIRSGVKFISVYNVTGIDPSELIKHGKIYHPDTIRRRPEKTMWELMEWKQMPPLRTHRYCCEWLKERNTPNSFIITGIRWQESNNRKKRAMIETSYKSEKVKYIHPIIDWTEDDVWEYIRENNLLYCSLYDEGFKRLGCVLCPMKTAKQRLYETKRFPQITQRWIKAFEIFNGKYDFNWWISNEPKVPDNQCSMFT